MQTSLSPQSASAQCSSMPIVSALMNNRRPASAMLASCCRAGLRAWAHWWLRWKGRYWPRACELRQSWSRRDTSKWKLVLQMISSCSPTTFARRTWCLKWHLIKRVNTVRAFTQSWNSCLVFSTSLLISNLKLYQRKKCNGWQLLCQKCHIFKHSIWWVKEASWMIKPLIGWNILKQSPNVSSCAVWRCNLVITILPRICVISCSAVLRSCLISLRSLWIWGIME